jgi:hypothetical protein
LPRPGWALLADPPGGRPLRRRREMVSIYGRQRLRGTAALQALRVFVLITAGSEIRPCYGVGVAKATL